MGGVFPCSPCSFGAFELAFIGNGYDFVYKQTVVPLQKCDFETLDRIKVEYVLNWTAISSEFLNVI